jgi:cytochrome c
MPAHPQLTEAQASAMVAYILSLADSKSNTPSLPDKGTYLPAAGSGDSPKGVIVLRAEYTDRGANGMSPISNEKTIVLHSPTVVVANGEFSEGISKQSVPELPVEIAVVSKQGASVAFKQIDLTGIIGVTFVASAPAQYGATGGKIEVHLDSPTGELLGETDVIRPTTNPAAPPSQMHTALHPTSGAHDVYLVFKNPDSKGDQFMLAALTATFASGSL